MRPNPHETKVWPHLLKKSLMKNFIFCAVQTVSLPTELTKETEMQHS